tara:strand:+ start:119 stop:367 length:249 start_codon:yes stop_codon:yes gene_type:complete
MIPSYHENDLIVCLKCFYSLRVGDVVLIKAPQLGVVIKRIKSLTKNKILIEGDNKQYTSMTYENEYSYNQVIAKVIFKFWRF